MVFRDRTDAGRRLGAALTRLRAEDVVVLGLPRGGVPVAFEVAKALDAPLDVIVVRKLGVLFQPELVMGAIDEGGVRVLNDEVLHLSRVKPSTLATVEAREREVVEKRATRLRQGHPRRSLIGKTAIIVVDRVTRSDEPNQRGIGGILLTGKLSDDEFAAHAHRRAETTGVTRDASSFR